MARRKDKADHRADNRGGPWAGLPHCVLDSPAYQHLSLWGRAVLVELVRTMNGYNNGSIVLSQRQIADRLRTSNFRQIGKAVAELMQHGFVDVEADGRWKQRMAREYRLTFVNTGKPGHYKAATNEYRAWTPTAPAQLSGADTVSADPPNPAEPVSARHPFAAEPVSAGLNGKLPKTPFGSAEPVSSLIDKPYLGTKFPDPKRGLNSPKIDGGDFAARVGGAQ